MLYKIKKMSTFGYVAFHRTTFLAAIASFVGVAAGVMLIDGSLDAKANAAKALKVLSRENKLPWIGIGLFLLGWTGVTLAASYDPLNEKLSDKHFYSTGAYALLIPLAVMIVMAIQQWSRNKWVHMIGFFLFVLAWGVFAWRLSLHPPTEIVSENRAWTAGSAAVLVVVSMLLLFWTRRWSAVSGKARTRFSHLQNMYFPGIAIFAVGLVMASLSIATF